MIKPAKAEEAESVTIRQPTGSRQAVQDMWFVHESVIEKFIIENPKKFMPCSCASSRRHRRLFIARLSGGPAERAGEGVKTNGGLFSPRKRKQLCS
jgi:hypothetical protein